MKILSNYTPLVIVYLYIISLLSYFFFSTNLAEAETGEIEFSCTNVAVTSDWKGSENNSLAYHIAFEWGDSFIKRQWQIEYGIEGKYGRMKSQEKATIKNDSIEIYCNARKDCIRKWNIDQYLKLKGKHYIEKSAYTTFLKWGLSKEADYIFFMKNDPVYDMEIYYHVAIGCSQRWSNQDCSLGLLGECTISAEYRNFKFKINDGDIFWDNQIILVDIPIFLEFSKDFWFAKKEWNIRGNENNLGTKSIFQVGVQYAF